MVLKETAFDPLVKRANGGAAPDLVIHLFLGNSIDGLPGGLTQVGSKYQGHFIFGVCLCPLNFFGFALAFKKLPGGLPGLFKSGQNLGCPHAECSGCRFRGGNATGHSHAQGCSIMIDRHEFVFKGNHGGQKGKGRPVVCVTA